MSTEKPEGERLQKVLSRVGFGSRRVCEALILEGKVKVNGQEAIIGMSISRKDLIEIDGKRVEISESTNQKN